MGPHKKRRKESSSSSDSESSSEEESSSKHRKRSRSSKKKTKLKKRKHVSSSSDTSTDTSSSEEEKKKLKTKKQKKKNKEKKTEEASSDIPLDLMARSKSMAPMTKEEWEKRQSVVRRVYDETSGRHRLIKGDGEVIEEIVSRDRHKAINQQATRGDGDFFQAQMAGHSKK